MTIIAALAEADGEPRVALSPETARKFIKLGCTVRIEAGAGKQSHFSNDAFSSDGVEIVDTRAGTIKDADILLCVRRPDVATLEGVKPGALVVGMLDPHGGRAELDALADTGLTAFSMELMPRITRAQSMDVLSSQANLAGYKAVIEAAAVFGQALPMMMTAAGTVPAARAFIMGVGVAGLQAIATARRLGAIVTATDVRPATKEQVSSLGAKFVAVEDDEFRAAETSAGYAKEMSDAYKQKQAELVAEHVKNQDIVITTALIPGRPAPKLISKEMVASMRSGSVIVDLAAERGGNCEETVPGETATVGGVTILGQTNLAGALPVNASSLYAKNLYAFLEPQIDKETGDLSIDWDDQTIAGTLIIRDGKIVHPTLVGESK